MIEQFKTTIKRFKAIRNEIDGIKLKIDKDLGELEKDLDSMTVGELRDFVKWVETTKNEIKGEKL